ncbi:Mediator of RNA polymerase II transcription subunit 16 [Homalodisca vitripennis]|nr:Mediator of RNA polymerase II transcription subunit 16 [Homalodisca vitripennis]
MISIVIVPEKKDNYQYSEKFTHVRFAPSVRQFGGRSVEGCLVISTTGMVGALAITKDGGNQTLITCTESLGSTRHRITAVDICYGKNGQYLVAVSSGSVHMPIQCYMVSVKGIDDKLSISSQGLPCTIKYCVLLTDGQYLVAVSSGSVHMPIQCFRVSVKRIDDKLSISSQALPSFFMLACTSTDHSYHTVTQLKFVVREDADTLVVAANGDSGALIEIWELQEKPLTIHKLFQSKVQSTEPFRTVLWQHQSQYPLSCPITCMTTLKMALMNTVPPPLYVIVVLTDGSIHCLSRDTLKQSAAAVTNARRPLRPARPFCEVEIHAIKWIPANYLFCTQNAYDQMDTRPVRAARPGKTRPTRHPKSRSRPGRAGLCRAGRNGWF